MSALEQVQSAVNSEDFGQSSCGSKQALRTEYTSNVLTEYEDFEDGHKPGNTKEKTRLAINKGKQSVKFLALFDALLEPIWCERAYDYALSRNGKPFGIYVRTDEALNGSIDAEQIWQSGDKQRALALVTTRALVFNRARPMLQNDITAIHGTAVWCLASGESNSVQAPFHLNERPFAYQYHIDYAELYRYETNVIHPPLYAGTCHVSPIGPGDMEGGDFCAHVGGLDHYRKFGYKGKLAVAKAQAQDACNSVHDLEASSINAEELILQDLRSDPAWQTVRYQCNRGILHDGDFAHLSTPIRRIADGKKRVIFGFNCFTEEVGPCCIRAPEHSDAFNRTVRLYQAMSGIQMATKYSASDVSKPVSDTSEPTALAAQGIANDSNAGNNKLRAQDLLKKPALAKLLVLAARKVQEHKARTGEDFLSQRKLS